ncbi:MAG: PAS domain-containing protein [Bacteroidia bacterium]|nr:PAS domain-containing protein [Bacteroidia bacterium]
MLRKILTLLFFMIVLALLPAGVFIFTQYHTSIHQQALEQRLYPAIKLLNQISPEIDLLQANAKSIILQKDAKHYPEQINSSSRFIDSTFTVLDQNNLIWDSQDLLNLFKQTKDSYKQVVENVKDIKVILNPEIVEKTDTNIVTKAYDVYSNQLTINTSNLKVQTQQLITELQRRVAGHEKNLEQGKWILAGGIAILMILLLTLIIITLLIVTRSLKPNIEAIQNYLTGITTQKEANLAIPKSTKELYEIGEMVKTLTNDYLASRTVFQKLYKKEPIEKEPISENLKKIALQIQSQIHKLEEELADQKEDNKQAQSVSIAAELDLKRRIQTNQIIINTIQDSIYYVELDLSGNIITFNTRLKNLLEYQANELTNKSLNILLGEIEFTEALSRMKTGEYFSELYTLLNKSQTTVPMQLSFAPVKERANQIVKYLVIGQQLDAIPQLEQPQTTTVTANPKLEEKLTELQHILVQAESDKALYQDQVRLANEALQTQKQLELRLTQQHTAIQELSKNNTIKDGNIDDALNYITETIVFTLDIERSGIWLFSDERSRLECLNLFERQRFQHSTGFEMFRDFSPTFFTALDSDKQLILTQALQNTITFEIRDSYLAPARIESMVLHPVHLAGQVVGYLFCEHILTNREWFLDEQNFVSSAAEIVSLILEQGNRRVLEEEIRMSLEEAHAMEVELRQNNEEIEATTEEVRRTQQELRGQIEALNNAAIVCETNTEGVITYVNEAFLRLYQYTRREILGRKITILYHPNTDLRKVDEMWATLKQGEVWKGVMEHYSHQNYIIWIEQTLTPVVGLDGKPHKYISVGFDITQQKLQEEQIRNALEVAQTQEELLVENSEEIQKTQIELTGQLNAINNASMVYETDLEGNITYVNDALLNVSGFSKDELLGKRYTILKSGRQPESTYQEQWKTILRGQIWRGEMEKRTKDGVFFWVLETNTPVLGLNQEPIKSINVLFDITAQKQQEFRLRSQQAALLDLTSNPAIKEGNLKVAFQVIAKVGMETLNVDRVSVWIFEDIGEKIRCKAVCQHGNHPHNEGMVLEKSIFPNYFKIIEKDRVLAVNDIETDPRSQELLQLFRESGVASFLDASIWQGGKSMGVISFEHRGQVRKWTLDEQSFAGSIADTVALALEQKERLLTDKLRLAYSQLEEANKEVIRQKEEIEEKTKGITESIRYAKRIQQNILPSKELMEQLSSNYFITFKPRDIVGGDFYWAGIHGNKKIVVLADGTGHGVPGAFLTLIGYIYLNQIVNQRQVTCPADILYHLHIGVRTTLKQDSEDATSRDGMDVALFCYDSETHLCEYAGANLPFTYYHDFEVFEIKPDKRSIGGEQIEDERRFTNHEIQLKIGDTVYLYTDGFVDQLGGPEEKRFTTKRLKELILRSQHESMAHQRAILNMEWKDWKNDREQLDDVSIFGMRIE